MSWVAEENATSQNTASVSLKKNGVGSAKAMQAKAMAIIHCMEIVHQRVVLTRSTNGLQNGFITHGR